MKKVYRVYNEKTGEVLLSFAATSDEEAIEKAKEMYDMKEHNLGRWNGMQDPNEWTKIN